MDPAHFDTLTRSLTEARSRRGVVATLLGGTLGLLGFTESDARNKKGKGKSKGKGNKEKNKSKQSQSPPPASPPPPPTSPPPGGCPSGQTPCAGGCIPSNQCCDSPDCSVSGQVCTTARQCACPPALPDTCGGECLAACPENQVRSPTCTCCKLPGYLNTLRTECCSGMDQVIGIGPIATRSCVGLPDGRSCSFSAQCDSNFCLCGAFGCSCQ